MMAEAPKGGWTWVSTTGIMAYGHYRATPEGGVHIEGDHYLDCALHVPLILRTSLTCTCTCTGTTINIPALSTPQPPASPDSSGYGHGVPLDDVSGGYGDVHMVVDLPDTLELIEINLNDEDPEDQHEGNL